MRFALLLALVSFQVLADVQALDPDFFGGSSPDNGGIQALDPDFFRNRRGELQNSREDQFGCTAVAGITARAEAGAIGRVVQNYCKENPSVRWVPRNAWNPGQKTGSPGYYQICCVRKANAETARRPGPR